VFTRRNTYNLATAHLAKGDIHAAAPLLEEVIQKDGSFVGPQTAFVGGVSHSPSMLLV
jgi:Tfp pilus assembly protein PilF